MKNKLLSLSLVLSLLLAAPAYAQENEETAQETSVEQVATGSVEKPSEENTAVEEKDDDHKGLRVQLDMDDDLTTDEKFEIATTAISKALGEDFSEELQLEIDGLTDEQKADFISSLEDGFVIDMTSDDIPLAALFIAVPAVILFLGMPIFIVLLVLWFGHKKRRQKMELVNVYLEANKEVPPQVLTSFDVGAASSLRRGLMLTALGVGIVAAFSAFGDADIGALGLIPLFVGVARLIYWYVEERKV